MATNARGVNIALWRRRSRAMLLGPFGLALMVATVAAGLLYDIDPSGFDEATSSNHTADYFMDNFTATTMDEAGRPKRRVDASHMSHYPDTDTHELIRPHLQMFKEGKLPWFVTSERGWVSANGEVMLLLGNVHIWRNGADGVRNMDIKTSDLRVLPDSDYGETDKPVTITTPHSQSRSVGMRAFLGEGRMEMLSQVRTVYDRNAFYE